MSNAVFNASLFYLWKIYLTLSVMKPVSRKELCMAPWLSFLLVIIFFIRETSCCAWARLVLTSVSHSYARPASWDVPLRRRPFLLRAPLPSSDPLTDSSVWVTIVAVVTAALQSLCFQLSLSQLSINYKWQVGKWKVTFFLSSRDRPEHSCTTVNTGEAAEVEWVHCGCGPDVVFSTHLSICRKFMYESKWTFDT